MFEISVIIPTFNRPQQLNDCLSALRHVRAPASGFEVVVVDDGGTARLEPIVERHQGALQLRVLRTDNRGPGAARNQGARAADGSHLAFTDDDCLPLPDWLVAFEHTFESHPERMLGGRTVNSLEADVFATASQLILDAAYSHYNDPSVARFFASCNMAVGRHRFLEIGGFDPGFRVASEDRELCDRWILSKGALAFVEEAVVDHAHHSTFASFAHQHFRYGRGAARYHRVRAERGGGNLIAEARNHGRHLKRFVEPLRELSVLSRAQMLGALMSWQIANAAGFAYEALRYRLGETVVALPVPGDPDPASVTPPATTSGADEKDDI